MKKYGLEKTVVEGNSKRKEEINNSVYAKVGCDEGPECDGAVC